MRPFHSLGFVLIVLSSLINASVTVYHQVPLGDSTTAAAAANYTGAAAYDPTVLTPPPVPTGLTTQFGIQLSSSSAAVQGLSIPQKGSFMGFSIEFSVINQIFGVNATYLQVPFLNLMALLRERAGEVHIRVGGNTQETAVLVDSLPGGVMITKEKGTTGDVTETPTLVYTAEVFYTMANISALVNTKWFLGMPFNDTSNLRLGTVEVSEAILGGPGYLLGYQVGNEPDLYAAHSNRPSTYSPSDYFGEFGIVVNAVNNDVNIPIKNNLVAPSISGTWTPESVWNTGLVGSYTSSLGWLAVEHYPTNNCFAEYGIGSPVNPQDVFQNFLNHTSSINIVAPYLNSTNFAQANGKPFIMMETNTASCGGLPGISDTFGAALWALDYGLQMAYSNFSGSMLHIGGQETYYNPFTPPPTNQSAYHQWTVGAVFYSTIVSAEVFGPSGNAQIVDLQANSISMYTPAYAIYENGAPMRLVLFNYVSDPTGASDYTTTISIGGSTMPAQINVKYLAAPSVSEKYNITWAGQTFGSTFQSDGRLKGSESVQTINCDQSSNTCQVTVPAPGVALVFLSSDAYAESGNPSTQTFSTTMVTKTKNTATVDPSVLATSNGMSGSTWELGSTSKENTAAGLRGSLSVVSVVGAAVLSTGLLWTRFRASSC
ncbi:glycoside hydrolase family 79 protein [Suillus paluster]|uniref:glycoside hydrolase family 79 protein n=1 Tax=Suillus paluster TaxID=48578 RepID=UPI001B867CE1|nr:glycoside hydrolase family 79 protein [Suillus paluster]KAG1737107.1 glycoside hydrolase family 79 protein [Suillus paluster]